MMASRCDMGGGSGERRRKNEHGGLLAGEGVILMWDVRLLLSNKMNRRVVTGEEPKLYHRLAQPWRYVGVPVLSFGLFLNSRRERERVSLVAFVLLFFIPSRCICICCQVGEKAPPPLSSAVCSYCMQSMYCMYLYVALHGFRCTYLPPNNLLSANSFITVLFSPPLSPQ